MNRSVQLPVYHRLMPHFMQTLEHLLYGREFHQDGHIVYTENPIPGSIHDTLIESQEEYEIHDDNVLLPPIVIAKEQSGSYDARMELYRTFIMAQYTPFFEKEHVEAHNGKEGWSGDMDGNRLPIQEKIDFSWDAVERMVETMGRTVQSTLPRPFILLDGSVFPMGFVEYFVVDFDTNFINSYNSSEFRVYHRASFESIARAFTERIQDERTMLEYFGPDRIYDALSNQTGYISVEGPKGEEFQYRTYRIGGAYNGFLDLENITDASFDIPQEVFLLPFRSEKGSIITGASYILNRAMEKALGDFDKRVRQR